ncbi:DUF4221 family protein [Algoriphagus aestuarii]|nr:DUF4221 family protein [Algoriphagus aestuarii]
MKKLFILLLFSLVFSCAEKEKSEGFQSKNILENLTYTVDTVAVDVGEEIFNPGMYFKFAKNENEPTVYFAMSQIPEIHAIDLNSLSLTKRIILDKDGPNRAPRYIQYFDLLPTGEFVLADYATQGIYTAEGEKTLSFLMEPEEFEGLEDELTSLNFNLLLSPDKKKGFSTPSKKLEFISQIAMVDLEAKTGKLIDLPALDLTRNFRTSYSFENGSTTYGDFLALKKIQNQLFITSGSTSDTYIYDFATDSLTLKRFEHQLVTSKKSGEYPARADSQERVQEIGEEIDKQVSFHQFYWDENREMYFRLGSKSNGKKESGEPKKRDVYLFAYDQNLTLLGETTLDLYYPLSRTFFYNGKLYSYMPIDENPGFVIFDLKFPTK